MILHLLDLIGVAIFAVNGVLVAVHSSMNLLGRFALRYAAQCPA